MAAAVDLLICSATVVYLRLTKLANAENWTGSIHECAAAVFLSAKNQYGAVLLVLHELFYVTNKPNKSCFSSFSNFTNETL